MRTDAVDNLDKVLVGYAHVGTVMEEFADSMAKLCLSETQFHDSLKLVGFAKASSCVLPGNRNHVVRDFLEHPAEPNWLLFVDVDIEFPPTIAHGLVTVANKVGAKIMAAPVQLTMGHANFYIKGDKEGTHFVPLKLMKNTVYELDQAGTGIMLIHRDVFTTMEEKLPHLKPWVWFGYEPPAGDNPKDMMTDDFTFCRRALSVGFKIHGYTGVSGVHIKKQRLEVKWYTENGVEV